MRILEAPAIGDQITMGKLHFYRREFYDLERTSRLDWQEERQRFLNAQRLAAGELRGLYDRAMAEMDKAEADKLSNGWQKAVKHSMHWLDEEE